jgi:hypothetical protein
MNGPGHELGRANVRYWGVTTDNRLREGRIGPQRLIHKRHRLCIAALSKNASKTPPGTLRGIPHSVFNSRLGVVRSVAWGLIMLCGVA